MFAKAKLRIQDQTIVAVELGGSKITAHVYRIHDQEGSLIHVASSCVQSKGLNRHTITRIEWLEESILNVLHTVEQQSKTTIKDAYIVVPSGILNSKMVENSIDLAGRSVTDETLRKLHDISVFMNQKKDEEILHVLPLRYSLDDMDHITDPRKMVGRKLSVLIHVITASKSFLHNVRQIFAHADVRIKGIIANPYACGLALLDEEAMQLGSTIIDIGAESTTLSCFLDGELMFFKHFSIGAHHITRHIARKLNLSMEAAERAKIHYGFVSVDAAVMTVNEPIVDGNIQRYIAPIIMSDVEDLTIQVFDVLNQLDPKVWDRILVTGGGSQISGLSEFWSRGFRKQVRQESTYTLPSPLNDMTLAASLGGIKYGFSDYYNRASDQFRPFSHQTIWQRIRHWFNEDF